MVQQNKESFKESFKLKNTIQKKDVILEILDKNIDRIITIISSYNKLHEINENEKIDPLSQKLK